MSLKHLLLCAALFSAVNAHATDEQISKEEFDQIVASPFKATNAKSSMVVEIHMKSDGSVVARQGYNDIGTWRRNGDAGYCIRWNKQRFDDRCTTFIKRDGKLALSPSSGNLEWWVESPPK